MAVDVVAIDVPGGDPGRMLQNEPDEALAALVRQGHESAFAVIYDRHHRGLLAFCRHMLSSKEEAEDALQHTFFAAYHALKGDGTPPRALKPWIYTIARNRCLTVLRARRPHEPADEDAGGGAVVIGLADEVQRRSDLRDLVADVQRLPEDQKAALVLFELGDFSHAEIAETLSVTREKVKALVFQAREGLLRARTARDTPCAEIRREVSSRTRALPRRGVVRGHLDRCPACAAFDLEVRRQRAALAIILPVVPSLELKGSVLGPMIGGGATIASGGAIIAGGGAGAGAGGIGLGSAGGAATAGVAGSAAAGAGGVAGLATSAGGLAGAGAASGLGALAAKTVVAKALTVVAVAAAAAGTGKVAEEVHQHASRPAPTASAPAKNKGPASVVTSSDPTITTALPATHTTVTTVTATPVATAPATTTTTGQQTSTGTTASAPSTTTSSSSTPPASGGASTPPASAPPVAAVDATTGGTAPVAATSEPAPASAPAASDPGAASTDPPAAPQHPPAATDSGAVTADAAAPVSANDVGTATASDPNGTLPPGCPVVNDPSSTSTVPPQITIDPVTAAPADPTAPGAGTTAAGDPCPPVAPAGGSPADPAAGATTAADVTEAIATP